MLISTKLLTLVTSLGSFVLANSFIPMQVALKNMEYESQGFRILENKNVEGYSVRIKQPKSCEGGIQVK
jgi:cathepsin A (carboxypeptidase C)